MKKLPALFKSALSFSALSVLIGLSTLLLIPATQAATNLEELTLKQMQQQISQGDLSSEAVVQYYLDVIAKHDDSGVQLNAVGQLNKNALKRAKMLDKERKNKGSRGPLHGIPVLLKDNIDTNDGMANTAGSRALQNNFPEKDAFLVEQLRKAGAIILGKANLSEWANFRSTHSSSGWSGMYGQTKNPYDITRSACGSSSGSGVAVAANLTMLAVGTETDGSVTCPASVNGIVGIKPTLGTVSRSGIIPLAHSQDTAGAMARTVTDAVHLLTAMVAVDKNDQGTVKSNVDYASHLKVDGLKGKRIGIVRNLMGYHPGVDKLFDQTLEVLKNQGAIIVDNANIDTVGKWDESEYEVLLYEFKADINEYLSHTKGDHPKTLEQLISYNKTHSPQEMPHFGQELFIMEHVKGPLSDKAYLKHKKDAKRLAGKEGIDATLKKYNVDILIAPTSQPAWKIDQINGDHYMGSASSPAATSGYPHITVPMGTVGDMPVGVSFFAGFLEEGKLIEAAFSYEQASKARVKPKL
ncbi:MAG: amidase [Psychrosphaera sp.]|nr:amidase [Psychrosphaera sp.]